jgi:hypothetical protein
MLNKRNKVKRKMKNKVREKEDGIKKCVEFEL